MTPLKTEIEKLEAFEDELKKVAVSAADLDVEWGEAVERLLARVQARLDMRYARRAREESGR